MPLTPSNLRSPIATAFVVATVVLLAGCGLLSGQDGPQPTTDECLAFDPPRITFLGPTESAQVEEGTAVLVAFSYSVGGWAYNTIEMHAPGALVCSMPITANSFTGACTWNTAGLVHDTMATITLVALDRASLVSCPPTGSVSIAVSVQARTPRIDTQPLNATVFEGQSASFAVSASGTAPLSYQWRRGGIDIGGATSASYTTPLAAVADTGAQYTVAVTNARTTTVSAPATLTVNPVPLSPVITGQPMALTVTVGDPATFTVAASGTAPLSYQWRRAASASAPFADIAGAVASSYTVPAAAFGDDGALFSVRVSNLTDPVGVTSAAAALTVLDAICPVPPRPDLDTSAPPVTTGPSVNYGVNLLNDPGFENTVRVGSAPDAFAYWRFDQAAGVAAQQGIAPRTAAGGSLMLQFVGTGPSDAIRGSASEQVQLIDVSALATAIDANGVRAEASAWFSRVAGCMQTDDAMGVQLMAFDGQPTNYGPRWTNGINAAIVQGVSRDDADVTTANAWLRHRTERFNHNSPGDRQGAIYGWRQATATMDLPVGTRFLAIVVFAIENRTNDNAFPELHGHYADDAAVVLSPR